MINNYVLDRDNLDVFLDCILEYATTSDLSINELIDECSYFTSSVYSNAYFFSKNMQKKITKEIYPNDYLNKVYDLQNNKAFYIEEFDRVFIEFLIAHISDLSIDLDSHLKEIQEDFVNSNYGKQIRY